LEGSRNTPATVDKFRMTAGALGVFALLYALLARVP
jgi:hypothetical protein